MKYTLTDGKEIRIPDKEILHLMNTMHIKAEQAVQIYLHPPKTLQIVKRRNTKEDSSNH